MTRTLHRHSPRTPHVPAAERRRVARARALEECRYGRHSMTPTFRTSEQVCIVCGLVTYCPDCLDAAHLLHPQREHAYPVECMQHRPQQRGGGQA